MRFAFPPFAALGALGVGLAILATAPAANAQANLSFSGGSGAPLTIGLLNLVSYTVTAAGTVNNAPLFVFQSVGNLFGNSSSTVTSTLTYRVNGGTAQTIQRINSGLTGLDLAATDVYINGFLIGVNIGDIVTLTSGTLTTNNSVAAAAPVAGSFTTFLATDGTRTRISNNGVAGAVVAAPEPGSIALLGIGFAGMTGVVARRKRSR